MTPDQGLVKLAVIVHTFLQSMARQRGKRRSGAAVRRVSWERGQGGRLDRLARAAHYVSEDLLVYDIDSVNRRAVERHTSAQSLPPVPKQSRGPGEGDWFSQLARFGRLDPVLAFLGVRDIQALHGVNRYSNCDGHIL